MSTQFANVERPPVFPVCLLVDVSGSMAGAPIRAVNEALPELRRAVLEDPSTGEIARITVVEFSSGARIVAPLAAAHQGAFPSLRAGGTTEFAAGFDTAATAIERGITALGRGTRFYRPVVFFLSDGGNTGPDWRPAWQRLTARDNRFGAEVVAFGMGQADRGTVGAVATRHAFFAGDADPATAVRSILRTVIGSIKTTSTSFGSPEGGGLTIPHDPGLTPLPVGQV